MFEKDEHRLERSQNYMLKNGFRKRERGLPTLRRDS